MNKYLKMDMLLQSKLLFFFNIIILGFYLKEKNAMHFLDTSIHKITHNCT